MPRLTHPSCDAERIPYPGIKARPRTVSVRALRTLAIVYGNKYKLNASHTHTEERDSCSKKRKRTESGQMECLPVKQQQNLAKCCPTPNNGRVTHNGSQLMLHL